MIDPFIAAGLAGLLKPKEGEKMSQFDNFLREYLGSKPITDPVDATVAIVALQMSDLLASWKVIELKGRGFLKERLGLQDRVNAWDTDFVEAAFRILLLSLKKEIADAMHDEVYKLQHPEGRKND